PPMLHIGGATSTRLRPSVSEFHSYKNRLRSILKTASLRTLLSMLPLHLAICAAAAIAGTLGGRPAAMANVGRAVMWNLVNARNTRASSRQVQASLYGPDP